MLFNGKLLDEVNEEDIHALVTFGYSEIKTREFKQILPGNSDNEKKEFLADVSSFANASGGFIVYGVKEENGIATSIQGLQISDQDSEKLRIESIIQNGVQPRIPGLIIQTILMQDRSYIFIIQIPKSWCSPHMVTYQNNSKFFSRNSSGKYQFDITEIKQAFLGSEGISDQIRNFRLDRISKIVAKETPIQLNHGAKIALHIIPIQSYLQNIEIPIVNLVKDHLKIETLATRSGNFRINLDGLVTFFTIRDGSNKSYTQVFRNGIIEILDEFILNRDNNELNIPITYLEKNIIESCTSLLSLLHSYNIESPYIIFLTLIEVKGYNFAFSQQMQSRLFMGIEESNFKIDREMIMFPEVILEIVSEISIQQGLRPLFDSIWNACGYQKSLNYDNTGKWNPI
jgi:hypothetical protein